MELTSKQKFILNALVLCLLNEWTLGRDPKRDLEELGIKKEIVYEAISDLIKQGLVCESIGKGKRMLHTYLILKNPKYFREEIILTEKGIETIKEWNLERLISDWHRYKKEF